MKTLPGFTVFFVGSVILILSILAIDSPPAPQPTSGLLSAWQDTYCGELEGHHSNLSRLIEYEPDNPFDRMDLERIEASQQRWCQDE